MNEAPGKHYREGLTLLEIADMFSDENKSRNWIEKRRWPEGPQCPHCGTHNVQCNIKHPRMTHRCRRCEGKPMFSVKTGTVMEGSKIKYRHWAVGIYLFTTNIKGISSMRLHRELGIGQKAAWFMLHRLRDAFENETGQFTGPVEVDETYIGGKRSNMSNNKRKEQTGRGAVGKTAIVGMKDRETNEVKAKVIDNPDKDTLQGFVADNADQDAKVYTDGATAYDGLPFDHEAVNHSVSEYVKDQAHTNGIESHWALLKRGYHGVYHKMSPKHLQRYVNEFAGRHNDRRCDTIEQMNKIVQGMTGKRLRYADLIADNGLNSGAR
ncbi:MAG: IS1595 family transposase [Gammaproteobacteria bacterium]|nr:IS1595 family transposase [Gammaproteobacteria bacterium]